MQIVIVNGVLKYIWIEYVNKILIGVGTPRVAKFGSNCSTIVEHKNKEKYYYTKTDSAQKCDCFGH